MSEAEPDREERVRRITSIYERLENDRHQFAIKHGFAYKGSQHYRGCVVVRWRRANHQHDRIREYARLCAELSDKFSLWEPDSPFLDSDLRLLKAGIYCLTEWDYKVWAIPDDNREVKDYVLSRLPAWAVVVQKPPAKS